MNLRAGVDVVVGILSQVCIVLVALIVTCVLGAVAYWAASLLLNRRHRQTIWEAGPPKKFKALLRILGHEIEANSASDSARDAQVDALREQVQELQGRQRRTDTVVARLMSSHTHAGGIDGPDFG